MIKIARYTRYGVKIAPSNANAKMKTAKEFGFFSPWILEPSHSNKVGQKTYMIRGVPKPETERKLDEMTVITLAMMATLFLNQRLRSIIKSNARMKPRIILGSLIE